MLRLGNKIKLVTREREFLSEIVGEAVSPSTVTEYNAWLMHIQETGCDTPEGRIVAALAGRMMIKVAYQTCRFAFTGCGDRGGH